MAKKMDKLSQDATNAIKAGMSYGKYMAMKNPAKITPDVVGYRHICHYCGKEFVTKKKGPRKYCDDKCREDYYYLQKRREREANGRK